MHLSVPTPVNTPAPVIPLDVIQERMRQTDYTSGEWANENNAVADFTRRLEAHSRWFVTYEEVRGTHLQPRPGQDPGNVRMDVLLSPTKALVAEGWQHGMIGVEIKRSGVKVGRPLAQMVDYGRSVFTIDGGRLVMPSMVMLYPWNGPGGGPFASMVIQNRLGAIAPTNDDGLVFFSGQTFAILSGDGTIELRNAVEKQGRKVGSR